MSKDFGRIADVVEVPNRDRKFGSAMFYLAIRVQDPTGAEKVILLTHAEYETALQRAYNNPEDCPKPEGVGDWLRDLVD